MDEKTINELRQKEQEIWQRRIRIGLIVLGAIAVVILAIIIWSLISNAKQYDSYTVISESQETGSKYTMFGSRLVKYSENGVAAIDGENVLWAEGFSYSEPTITMSEDYMLIYDLGGNAATVYDKDGLQASYSLNQTIALAAVSDYGMGAFLTQGESSSSVLFYDRTGRQMDIEVKNVLAESSGYPISMSLSPSGTGLALSLVFMDTGSMQSRVSFLNFDAGMEKADRVVGYFEYDQALIPQVSYISEKSVVAFADNKIIFYDLSDETSPSINNEYELTEKIYSVCAAKGMVALVKAGTDGGYELIVYDEKGSETLSYSFDFEYTELGISGDYVLIYGGEQTLITTAKHVKYAGAFDGIIEGMISTGKDSFLQTGNFGKREVELG